jgi:hypothetical protein
MNVITRLLDTAKLRLTAPAALNECLGRRVEIGEWIRKVGDGGRPRRRRRRGRRLHDVEHRDDHDEYCRQARHPVPNNCAKRFAEPSVDHLATSVCNRPDAGPFFARRRTPPWRTCRRDPTRP